MFLIVSSVGIRLRKQRTSLPHSTQRNSYLVLRQYIFFSPTGEYSWLKPAADIFCTTDKNSPFFVFFFSTANARLH